ncbi:MAG: MTAP family purine nucleoside phosphorylase, partial [Candidatus Nanopelagicales bacterium]
LTRHGVDHSVPPHKINYRANIQALVDFGVEDVLAVNVVGGVDPKLPVGGLQIMEDFLDFTKNRISTFHDGEDGVIHTEMTNAYNKDLREVVLQAAKNVGIEVAKGGVYACFDGPRFESAAEIKMTSILGGTVVGMTGVPEVTLAAEKSLRYAALSLIVNPAAGLSDEVIEVDEIDRIIKTTGEKVIKIIDESIRLLSNK